MSMKQIANQVFHINDSDEGSQSTNSATASPLPAKKPKLLASHSAQQSSSPSATGNSLQQLNKYLNMDDDEECLAFWHRNKSTLNKMVHPAFRALSILQLVLPLSKLLARVVLFYHLIAHACLTAYCLNLLYF